MSRVTNIIITTGLSEDIDYLSEKFKQYNVNGVPFNMVSIESGFLPKGWYGGNKLIEANILLGAFNYLDLDSLITHLREQINWIDPSLVQIIVKTQDEFKFSIIDLIPE